MPGRKYPMNHSKPASPDSAHQDTCDTDVNLDFIDEFTRQVNSFTERINTWAARNKPMKKERSALAEIHRAGPETSPESNETTLSDDEFQEIVDSIVYGGPGLDDEETHEEQEISKLPLYAGPEDLVFGDSILTGSQSKADEESNTSTTDHDHLVFYG